MEVLHFLVDRMNIPKHAAEEGIIAGDVRVVLAQAWKEGRTEGELTRRHAILLEGLHPSNPTPKP